jgi:hypothetical protein
MTIDILKTAHAAAKAGSREYYDNLMLTFADQAYEAVPPLLEAVDALRDLVFVINDDKDGGYFICAEAQPLIDRARLILDQVDALNVDNSHDEPAPEESPSP